MLLLHLEREEAEVPEGGDPSAAAAGRAPRPPGSALARPAAAPAAGRLCTRDECRSLRPHLPGTNTEWTETWLRGQGHGRDQTLHRGWGLAPQTHSEAAIYTHVCCARVLRVVRSYANVKQQYECDRFTLRAELPDIGLQGRSLCLPDSRLPCKLRGVPHRAALWQQRAPGQGCRTLAGQQVPLCVPIEAAACSAPAACPVLGGSREVRTCRPVLRGFMELQGKPLRDHQGMRPVNARLRFSCEVRDSDDVWDRWGWPFLRTPAIVSPPFTPARMGSMGERLYVVHSSIHSMVPLLQQAWSSAGDPAQVLARRSPWSPTPAEQQEVRAQVLRDHSVERRPG